MSQAKKAWQIAFDGENWQAKILLFKQSLKYTS